MVDTLQTLPAFAYLIPAVMLFRVGDFAAMLAVVAYAIVPAIRYTAHGIRQIDPALIEAATAAGCTKGQILRKVQLPLALPEIMLGVNQTIMMALSMLVITALVGTRDLGQEVYIALTKADVGRGLVAGVCVACIAMIADRLIAPWAAARKRRLGLGMMATERAERKAAALACWYGQVEPAPLGGGISNHNFLVEDRGQRFIVRIGDDIEVHNVLRRFELAASRAAHAAGIAPEVVHAEPGAMVFPYVDGRTLTPEDVRDPAMLARIVPLVRRCHREVPKHFRGPAPMFWVFQVVRDYAARLREDGSRMAPELPRLLAAADRLEAAVGPVELVFGHNDLLAANLIDDGGRLWLVDWEYGGFNSPLFDLGGLASNNELSPGQEDWLLEAYFERPSPTPFAAATPP